MFEPSGLGQTDGRWLAAEKDKFGTTRFLYQDPAALREVHAFLGIGTDTTTSTANTAPPVVTRAEPAHIVVNQDAHSGETGPAPREGFLSRAKARWRCQKCPSSCKERKITLLP